MKRNATLLVFLAGAYFALPSSIARADGTECTTSGDCYQQAVYWCGGSEMYSDYCCCFTPGGSDSICAWDCQGYDYGSGIGCGYLGSLGATCDVWY